jgi:hypothetical protein
LIIEETSWMKQWRNYWRRSPPIEPIGNAVAIGDDARISGWESF